MGFTSMVSGPVQSASTPKSRIVQSVRSTYGRDMMSPHSFSVSPSFSFGAIMSSAETNCELMFP